MEEVQGPTPAGTGKPYRALTEALRAHRIDERNHAFIEAVVAQCDVTSLIDRGRYIEARRRRATALHIGKTYTNGFAEDEQIVVNGAVLRMLPSEGRAPYFYVTHPSELPGMPAPRTRRSGSRTTAAPRRESASRPPKPVERDYGVCEECFMQRTASGACGC